MLPAPMEKVAGPSGLAICQTQYQSRLAVMVYVFLVVTPSLVRGCRESRGDIYRPQYRHCERGNTTAVSLPARVCLWQITFIPNDHVVTVSPHQTHGGSEMDQLSAHTPTTQS
ncbi:hypothetical protein BaRGS_00019682 [Batillaria attramentaria]|uniref:Secreted protein n=1 Tax=Batillaria attramentaria TaxID=370345 RepID=A0ABD0KPZ4_9CAEN